MSRRPLVAWVLCSTLCASAACGGALRYIPAPRHDAIADLEQVPDSPAYRFLASEQGPVRFARVADGVYRGGQPDEQDLEQLRALGVRTIINLRREDADAWRHEEVAARRLGLRFLHFPFYGVFGAKEAFLRQIISEMRKGHVYVHCLHGRDRTSLVVALYRVLVEDWDPKLAWKLEAIDYGSAQTFWYRQLRVAYDRIVESLPRPPAMAAKTTTRPAEAAEKMPPGPVVPPPPGATPAPTHTVPASLRDGLD